MERGARLSSSTSPLAEHHDLVLLDLDGVVYVGPDAVPHAVEAIQQVGDSVAYLTNNATRPAADVAEHLRSFGLSLTDEAVVTAGQVVADLVLAEVGAGAPVLLAGADGMRVALEHVGLRVVTSLEDDPRAVVQGGVIDVRWSELAEASYAIAAGVPWFASNPDLTFPTPRGLAPGNGAMVDAVALATGTRPVVAGKPERPIYDEARRRTGAASPIMVGDRPDTDIDGAIGADIESLVVLTGVSSLSDVMGLPEGSRPGFVATDLRGLHEVHPPVEVADGRATCGEAVAELRNGEIMVSGAEERSVPALRAAVALAWDTRDRGAYLSTLDVRMDA
ncbi:HAD-IIA family hydrolase [Aeromicrobium alkaliterrae]|uniref:HAD hydrolase-like protein n=1 Tax=Aeromicrobium alkaliterrae TaxID=302168 RepID=A0ABN2JPE9_9ACTN